MRGKLRDKREEKRDRMKRESLGRRPPRREQRNLQLQHIDNEEEENVLEETEELTVSENQKN